MKKSNFKGLVFLTLALWSMTLTGQDKEIRKRFSEVSQVQMDIRYGDLVVSKSSNDEVSLQVLVNVEGKSEESIKQVLDRFNMKTSKAGNRLRINLDFEVKQWNERNGRMTLTFDDGTRIKDLSQIEVQYFLSVPDLEQLEISTKYKDIEITQNLNTDLKVNLYTGNLTAQDISGSFSMDCKYGKARIKKTGAADVKLYDGQLEMGNSGLVQLDSKYSDIEMGSCESLDLLSYEDDFRSRNIQKMLEVDAKYSKIEVGDFQEAQLELYDSNLELGSGSQVKVSSKYGDLKLGILKELAFSLSYDDDISVTELESLDLNSKYSKVDIGRVTKRLRLDSYNDQVDINRFEGNMELLEFNGKYTSLDLGMSSELEFRIKATLTYGDLKFEESAYHIQYLKEKNNQIEFSAKTKGANEQSPLVELVGYDCKIRL